MGFTAYVAYKNDSGTYDLHRSENGGDKYMLRTVLEDYVRNNRSRSADHVPQSRAVLDAAKELHKTSPWNNAETIEYPDIINPDPVYVNIERDQICKILSGYDLEALYTVEDDHVETYIPLNTNPLAIKTVQDHTQIQLYRLKQGEHPQEIVENSGRTPDYTLGQDDFIPENLQTHPYWVVKTIEQGHRYFLSNAFKASNIYQQTGNNIPQITIFSGIVSAVALNDTTEIDEIIKTTLPIEVSFDMNGNPSYPMEADSIERVGAEPNVFASKLRYNIHKHLVNSLRTATTDQEHTDAVVNHAEQIGKDIGEKYGTKIEFSLVPDKVEKATKEITRQRKNPVTDNLISDI
jgi:hypothetical protein